jgi:hypothetical protein
MPPQAAGEMLPSRARREADNHPVRTSLHQGGRPRKGKPATRTPRTTSSHDRNTPQQSPSSPPRPARSCATARTPCRPRSPPRYRSRPREQEQHSGTTMAREKTSSLLRRRRIAAPRPTSTTEAWTRRDELLCFRPGRIRSENTTAAGQKPATSGKEPLVRLPKPRLLWPNLPSAALGRHRRQEGFRSAGTCGRRA